MKLKVFTNGGCGSMVFDEDASKTEIAEAMQLFALTEPGNGSGKMFYRKKDTDEKKNNSKERT